MTQEELDQLWGDDKNWRWGIIYFAIKDPRVVVPKKLKWSGWTLNFARPWAVPVLFMFILMAIVPAMCVVAFGEPTALNVILSILFSLVLIIVSAIYLSSSKCID